MDTDSFIVHIKTDDIYEDIAKDVETRFDTSNFEIDRPLPKVLRAKTYSCLKDDNNEDKEQKNKKEQKSVS